MSPREQRMHAGTQGRRDARTGHLKWLGLLLTKVTVEEFETIYDLL